MSGHHTLAAQMLAAAQELKEATASGATPGNPALTRRLQDAVEHATSKLAESIVSGRESPLKSEPDVEDNVTPPNPAPARPVGVTARAAQLAMYTRLRAYTRAWELSRRTRDDFLRLDRQVLKAEPRLTSMVTQHLSRVYTDDLLPPDANSHISTEASIEDTQYFDLDAGPTEA